MRKRRVAAGTDWGGLRGRRGAANEYESMKAAVSAVRISQRRPTANLEELEGASRVWQLRRRRRDSADQDGEVIAADLVAQ